MNCSEFEKELEQLVETRGESLPDSAAAHASECASCQLLYRDHQLLSLAMVQWRPVEIPSSLVASVLREVLDEQLSQPIQAATRRVAGRGWLPVAAVACLLVIMGIGVSLRSGSIDETMTRNGNRLPTDRIPTAGAPVEVATSMAAVLDDLKTEYRGLAADTTATARELAVVIPTAQAIPWGELSMSNIAAKPTVINDEPDASGGVTAIGRSIGTQITQAMDFLWSTVPAEVPQG